MISLFLAKLSDPISFALAIAVVQFSRTIWIIVPAAVCAAVVGETMLVFIQLDGTWGQDLPMGLLAGMVQASAVFGVRSLFDARKPDPDRASRNEHRPAGDGPPDRRGEIAPITVDDVGEHLDKMGYRLTIVGAGYAIMQRKSGFGTVEVASQIALHTLALDLRNAGTDIERIAEIAENAKRIIGLLNGYKSAGKIRAVQWEKDTRAIAGIAFPGHQQDAWLESTLNNPMVGETRLAVNVSDDDEDMSSGVL